MKEIYLNFLTKKKDARRASYEDMESRTNMSKSKLQRIFTGQTDPTVSDLEIIVEKGLQSSLVELYALIGKQEMEASEELDYKGAHALMEEFAREKAQIHESYKVNIEHLMQKSDERQEAFTKALTVIGEQYRANADYLTGVIRDNEGYIRDLLAKTEHSNAIAIAEQKRAEDAEERAKNAEERAKISDERADSSEKENRTTRKKMYKLFSGMLALVILLVVLLALDIVFDLL